MHILSVIEQRFKLYQDEIIITRNLQSQSWIDPVDVERLEEAISDLKACLDQGQMVLIAVRQTLDEVMPEF